MERPNIELEFVKMAFPAVGALWVFYGVTLLGLMKQLQDPGSILKWPPLGRYGLLAAVTSFLIVNLLAIYGMQSFLYEMAVQLKPALQAYRPGLWMLIGLHGIIDVATVLATYHALELKGSNRTPA